jgi:hypothetical protein
MDYSFIVLIAVIFFCALFGSLLGPVQTPVKDKIKKEPFQFSLARLLLVTVAVAIVLGTLKTLHDFNEPGLVVAASIIAFAVGIITLIYKKGDIKWIIITVFWFSIILFLLIFISSFFPTIRT